VDELKQTKQLGGQNYKVHLDGYNQMDLITGKGPSARHEIFYFAESTLGAVRVNDFKYRFVDQPGGWLGNTVKVDWPILVNLRLDPLERTSLPSQSMNQYSWFAYEFWRFVLVQQVVGQGAQTLIEFPPMQKGATFNLQQLKEELDKKMQSQTPQ
jgi:arylsulfatase